MPGQDLDHAIVNAEGTAEKLRAVGAVAKELAAAVKKPEQELEALAAHLRKAQGRSPVEAARYLQAATESKRRFEEEKAKVEKLIRSLGEKLQSLQKPTRA
jgi:hypothetical protein